MRPEPTEGARTVRSSTVSRVAGAVCLAGVAVTHLIDLPDKLEEAHYMAALFCALIVASLVLATALLLGRRVRDAWLAAGVLAALTIAGFVASRTIGLPQLEDHVGVWGDPVGIASLVFEAALVALAAREVPTAGAGRRPRPAQAGH
jgi:hypothetical protein